MSAMRIVKCQRSLVTSERVPQMLFYDVDRLLFWEGAVTQVWAGLFDQYGDRFFAAVDWPSSFEAPRFHMILQEQGW